MLLNLSTLPTELIELVASESEHADLFSLRRVCRSINEKIFRFFSHTCFSIIQTDLSYDSLRKLKELSKHEQIRLCVQTLHIREPANDPARDLLWIRHSSGHLIASSPGIEMLRLLLMKLVNCRSYRVCHRQDTSDAYCDNHLKPSDAVTIVLSLIATISLPIRGFHLDFTRYGTYSIDLKRLDVIQYQNKKFKDGWANLQELLIEHTLLPENLDWTTNLVLSASSLQVLEVRPHYDDSVYSFFDRLACADALPRLQELSLKSTHVTEELLSRLILRFHDSLRTISFSWINICGGGNWLSVFEMLGRKFSHLEHLSVHSIREAGLESRLLTFPLLEDNSTVPDTAGRSFKLMYKKRRGIEQVHGASYHGPHMNDALQMLIRSAVYQSERT